MIGKLDEYLLATKCGLRALKVLRHLLRVVQAFELEKGLVFRAQEEHILHGAKGQAQKDYLVFGELIGYVAEVDDARSLRLFVVVEASLFGVVYVRGRWAIAIAVIRLIGRVVIGRVS